MYSITINNYPLPFFTLSKSLSCFPLSDIPHIISSTPGPNSVFAATALAFANVSPVPLTSAAIVSPFANPLANGKLALKYDKPPILVTCPMGTVTGRFWPERYTMELVSGATVAGTAYVTVWLLVEEGGVATVSGPKVGTAAATRATPGQEPGTMTFWRKVNCNALASCKFP